jgi:hypothetical protein
VIEPDNPALKDRLVGLRLRKTELDQDIARLPDTKTGSEFNLNAGKLGKLPAAMCKRMAEGPAPGRASAGRETSPTMVVAPLRRALAMACRPG